jgi:putative tryptophan/tyrosine transport system substrate-binding protein
LVSTFKLATMAAGTSAVAALVLLLPATPESKSLPIVGFLSPSWPPQPSQTEPRLSQELERFGYVSGRDVTILGRFAEGKDELLDPLAADLVTRKPAAIVAMQPGGALAAQRATKDIPIVFVSISDPIRMGLVSSLRAPGGNITGVTNTPVDLNRKRLEILKDALPQLQRVAIIARAGNPNSQAHLAETVAAARDIGLRARVYNVEGPGQFAETFESLSGDGMEAVLLVQDGVLFSLRREILDLALKHKIPLIADGRIYARDRALLSYGISDYSQLIASAALQVDMILKGAHPSKIPVEQPMDVGLAVNLQTARHLGVKVPLSVLRRADEVIE